MFIKQANLKKVNTYGKINTAAPHVDCYKKRSNKQFPAASGNSNSRKTTLKRHRFHSVDIEKRSVLNGSRKSRCVSPCSLNIKEDMSINLSKYAWFPFSLPFSFYYLFYNAICEILSSNE